MKTTAQLLITFPTAPVFTGSFGGQLKRLHELLQLRAVTCQDAEFLGVAGSALPRRIKDLKDKYHVRIETTKIDYIRVYDGKLTKISQYKLI